MKKAKRVKRPESFAAGVGRGLKLAAKAARKTARMYGAPIYVRGWQSGRQKTVAETLRQLVRGR